jgi:hypothetical protein
LFLATFEHSIMQGSGKTGLGGRVEDRSREWFVPKRGPKWVRLLIGLSFWPYTVMNASYVVIGSLLVGTIYYDRLWGMTLVYVLAVGLAAHSLDAMGPNKPWGNYLSRRKLFGLTLAGLVPALGLGMFYAVTVAPILIPLGCVELFFLLAYNLEWFRGLFHGDFWFATSWGFLPVLVGYAVQSDTLSLVSLAGGLFGFATAFVEINASRPYKALKKEPEGDSSGTAARLESILKGIVTCVVAAAVLLLALALSR